MAKSPKDTRSSSLIACPDERRANSRRLFLRDGLLSLSLLPFLGCGGGSASDLDINSGAEQRTPGQLSPDKPTQSIIIIGAGIAGLVAGYELSRAGHQVIILEARERSGGRVNTLHCPFSDGQFAEAGASRIPSNHDLTLNYCNYFNLVLDRFYPDSGLYFEIENGVSSSVSASQYINQPPWLGSVNRSAYMKVRGGMSNLPNAFASVLANNIVYSQPVEMVQQDSTGVTVTVVNGETYFANSILCTVPLPVLNNIEFLPALSVQKEEAIVGGYHYTDSTRFYTQFSSRFWQESNLNAWGDTDWPEEIWQPTWDDSGNGGIIQSYLRGAVAQQFDLLSVEEQIAQVYERWRIPLGQFESSILTNNVHSWAQEEWSGAAFASPTIGQESRLGTHISLAEGRVHFAGEHASNYHGWIQGALESGIRAAVEIHERV